MRRIITRFEPKQARGIGFVENLPPLSREERLDVYASGWFIRIEESMLDDYEAVAGVLGAEKFARLLREYLGKHPSSSYTLADTGNAFPEFLKTWKGAAKRPWLYDLACLERAFYQSYSTRDPIPWSVADLQGISPEKMSKLRIETEASVFLVRSSWRIHDTWKESSGRPARAPTRLLVFRKGFDVRVVEIGDGQYRALKRAQAGCLLADWLSRSGGETCIPWLTEWAADGVLRPVSEEKRR